MVAKLIFFLALCTVFPSCVKYASAVDCISAYDSTQNYFPFAYDSESDPFSLPLDALTISTAFDFTVQYSNSYKIVRNKFSNDTYVLYQCGTPAPTGFSNSTKLIEIPVKGVALTGTTPIAYLELLGLINQVKQVDMAYTAPYICSACMLKIISESKVDNLNTSSDILVIEDMLTSPATKNYISFDATSDPGPLKRAEWIKFLALFFNLEAEASAIYQTIEKNYNCFNVSSTTKTVVAWMAYYNGTWTVSDKQYKKGLVQDAGGLSIDNMYYGFYDMNNSTQADAFKQFLKTVDVAIDESYAPDPFTYDLNTFASSANISNDSSIPFMLNKRLWREDRRVTNTSSLDWLETAPAQPQIVLQELISIINPSINRKPYFFRNIATGEKAVSVSAKDCERDYNTPLSPMIFACPTSPIKSSSYLSLPNVHLIMGIIFMIKFLMG